VTSAIRDEGLECADISKTYGRTQVLAPTTIGFGSGAVHALVGANGAGKSTLLGILTGKVTPTTGSVRFEGQELPFGSPRKIRRHGVAAVYQELEIIPGISALANVFLGTEKHRAGWLWQDPMRGEYRQLLERLKVNIDPDVRAGNLSVAQQQSLEIMRALRSNARVLLFDEPTASLALAERQTLLSVISDLAAGGMTVAFVSHQLDEVLQVSDTVTVLRNGAIVARGAVDEFDKQRLIQEMAGSTSLTADPGLTGGGRDRVVTGGGRDRVVAGARAFVVNDLYLEDRVGHVSLSVSPGEVVGLAGLVGAGRSSILRSLAGAESHADGMLTVGGIKRRVPRTVRAGRGLGLAMLPEDRKSEGLLSERSVEDNVSLSRYGSSARWGIVRPKRQRAITDVWRDRVHLTAYRPGIRARMLSGGNQQKVLLARVLQVRPKIVLADEPTRGVDVAAKEQVLAALREFADNGGSVIMTSSEIEEVLGVSDRIYVIHAGQVVREITDVGPHISVESVLASAFGQNDA